MSMPPRRSWQCALSIQSTLHAAKLEEGVSLSVKLGIGVGRISVLHLGGIFRRMEYVAVGEPLVQAFAAEHHAEAGGEVRVRGGCALGGGGLIRGEWCSVQSCPVLDPCNTNRTLCCHA